MTIAKTDARKQYAGDDVTTAFAFPYRFFADSDLQVYLLVDATGVETLQTLTTHYTVSNNGDETGGTVTMVTAPATGETLTILRAVPQTQGTDYAANDPFPAETHEAALDKLTLLVQQIEERVDRALIAPASDSASVELPIDRAEKYLAFDANKNPVALDVITAVVEIAPWEEIEDTYDFSVDGAVASVESSTLADGYEYMFVFLDLSPADFAVNLQMELYLETDTAYHSSVLQISNTVGSNTDDLYGFAELEFTRTTNDLKLIKVLLEEDGNVATGADTAVALNADNYSQLVNLATAQKIGKVRFSWSGGNIDAGKIVMYRR